MESFDEVLGQTVDYWRLRMWKMGWGEKSVKWDDRPVSRGFYDRKQGELRIEMRDAIKAIRLGVTYECSVRPQYTGHAVFKDFRAEEPLFEGTIEECAAWLKGRDTT